MERERVACTGMTPPPFTSASPGWGKNHGWQKPIGAVLIAAGVMLNGLIR